MIKSHEVHTVHVGPVDYFRLSMHREGGRVYHAPALYTTREQAESAAETLREKEGNPYDQHLVPGAR